MFYLTWLKQVTLTSLKSNEKIIYLQRKSLTANNRLKERLFFWHLDGGGTSQPQDERLPDSPSSVCSQAGNVSVWDREADSVRRPQAAQAQESRDPGRVRVADSGNHPGEGKSARPCHRLGNWAGYLTSLSQRCPWV